MTPIDYLKSLIAGQEVSSIPVQLSELKFLLKLLENPDALGLAKQPVQ